MLATYGVDTLDPAVSTRRVWVLLQRLPPYARRPGEEWSTEAELLAMLIDHVAELTWVTMRVNGAKGVTRPRPIRRPPKRPVLTAAATGNAPAGRGHYSGPDGETGPAGRPGDVKHGSWADAIKALAGMPNVEVDRRLCLLTGVLKSPSPGTPGR
jgi:hypothetical protein